VRQFHARLMRAAKIGMRRIQRITEMRGHLWEKPFPTLSARQPPTKPIRPPKITRDQFCPSLEQQETRAVKKLHQSAGFGNPPLGEQHEPSVLLQIIRHVANRVSGGGVDGKRPPIEHHQATQPVALRDLARHHEFPVLVQHNTQKQPVQPGDVIGHQQRRPRRLERLHVKGAKTKKDTYESAG
jgi:hypothetical protein